MKYAFPSLAGDIRFQTWNVVRRALVSAGHIVTDAIEPDTDAVLYSACDVLDIKGLRALRKSTDKPIIVGGGFCFNYWSAKNYADIVWIGEVFDFAKLSCLDDIAASDSAYIGDDAKPLRASQYINWAQIPITQIAPKKAYYFAGSGCKNNCRFCFTSWTHKHQNADDALISAAIREAKKRGIHLMITSNEYDADIDTQTKDMLLVDYLRFPVSGRYVRLGVEFALEDTRKRLGKPITRDQIFAAIQKAGIDNVALKLFHISGYEPVEAWDTYIDEMALMLDRAKNKSLVHLEFNNLQYQNYTPLYTERRSINPDNYIDIKKTRAWYDRLRMFSRHVLVGAPSPFKHVACRMGIELATTREVADYWFSMLAHKDKLSTKQAYDALFSSGVLDTPRRVINQSTGAIRIIPEAAGLVIQDGTSYV